MKKGMILFFVLAVVMTACQKEEWPGVTANVKMEVAAGPDESSVTIRFIPNEETAKAAKLELLPLPEGKSFAFSTRWDDSNPNHVRMAELLAKHGFKATFYLCSTSRKGFYSDVLPQLIRKGHSIGNHTLNHRNLATLIPNEVARQILQERPVRLERMARLIEHEYVWQGQRKSRGVKTANFAVLRGTRMPAVLTELGFISNRGEERFMKSRKGQKRLARCISDAFIRYRRDLR